MPEAETEQGSGLVREVENLVERTEVRDIRLQKVAGEVFRTPPSEMTVSLQRDEPKYVIEDDSILALFTNTIEYAATDPTDQATETPIARLTATHIVELTLAEGDQPSPEAVSLLLNGNVLFMVYPYVRSALHRLPTELGLPSILLPYLRREMGAAPSDETISARSDADGV